MKKKFAFILLAVMIAVSCVFGLTACSGNGNDHVHSLEYHAKVDPTCTTDGNIEYWSCSGCGKNFSDENGTTEIKDVGISAEHKFVDGICIECGEIENYTSGLEYKLADDGKSYILIGVPYSIEEVIIPKTYMGLPITSIGAMAFMEHISLKSVTIYDNITEIGYRAFNTCSSLISVILPNSITSIGEEAFAYCSSLAKFTFCKSIINVGYKAFYGCTALNDVYFIGDIEDWCNIIYDDNSRFSNPLYNGANLYINGEILSDLVIPDSVTIIKDNVFRCCG